jgi:hypothetical protein
MQLAFVWYFEPLYLGFILDFDIRISDLFLSVSVRVRPWLFFRVFRVFRGLRGGKI